MNSPISDLTQVELVVPNKKINPLRIKFMTLPYARQIDCYQERPRAQFEKRFSHNSKK